jgi:uncharacterized protein YecE (DUF72 family)
MSTARDVLVGTSGYSFKDWVGPFYPAGTRNADFLEYYARQFPVVEVNSTYYGIPKPHVLGNMGKRTPAGFRFVVKLHQSMTHEPKPDPAKVREFLEAIAPLKESGKYEGLLAQFPWRFRRDAESKAHLEALREQLPGEPLFAEFRNDSWAHPRLEEWLRERAIGYVAVDEPKLAGLMPPLSILSTDTAYVRFHGRNAAAWWGPKGVDRYDYDYSEPELQEWMEKIAKLAEQAKRTYLFFNNCHAGQAARSAKLMQELLRRQGILAG